MFQRVTSTFCILRKYWNFFLFLKAPGQTPKKYFFICCSSVSTLPGNWNRDEKIITCSNIPNIWNFFWVRDDDVSNPLVRQPWRQFFNFFFLFFCRHIVEHEGPRALFRGLGPNLVGVAPSRAIYFCAYSQSKEFFNTIMSPDTAFVHLCSAGCAGKFSKLKKIFFLLM